MLLFVPFNYWVEFNLGFYSFDVIRTFVLSLDFIPTVLVENFSSFGPQDRSFGKMRKEKEEGETIKYKTFKT